MVKYLTLDLSSGLDLRVMTLSPGLGSMLGVESKKKKKKKKANLLFPNLDYLEIKNAFLDNYQVKEGIKREIISCLRRNEKESMLYQTYVP